MWNEFLPISMPMTVIAALSFWDMALLVSGAPGQFDALAGPEHGRTIPLAGIDPSGRRPAGPTPRFRTIQVRLKDLPGTLRQAAGAVE